MGRILLICDDWSMNRSVENMRTIIEYAAITIFLMLLASAESIADLIFG